MPRRYAWTDAIHAEMFDALAYMLGDFEPPQRTPTPAVRHYYASLTGATSGTTLDLVQEPSGVWGYLGKTRPTQPAADRDPTRPASASGRPRARGSTPVRDRS
jgi:hypothetical protein